VSKRPSFYDVLTAAVSDIATHGYDSPERLVQWQRKLAEAAQILMGPPAYIERLMRDALEAVYRNLIERNGYMRYHPGVARFTIERVMPKFRAHLDRYIWSNADLIKLNREQAKTETLRRFSGWASSVPIGGSAETDRMKVKAQIKKPLYSLPFVERRCAVDQSHKLFAAINETIAASGNALAAIWHDHGEHDTRYNARKEHLARSGKVFLVRGNWALKAGLIAKGDYQYTDEIEMVGELVSCRCYYEYIYNLRSLPRDTLTKKGASELERVKVA